MLMAEVDREITILSWGIWTHEPPDEMANTSRPPNGVSRGGIVVFLYVAPIIIAVLLGVLVGYLVSERDCGSSSTCQTTNPLSSKSDVPGVLDPLSSEEMTKIERVLIDKNLINDRSKPLDFSSAYISSMSIFPPSKDDVLLYFNEHKFVGRLAEVHVIGKTDIQILHVGPLQDDPVPVENIHTFPLESRHIDEFVIEELEKLLAPVMAELEVLLAESFDRATYPEDVAINFNTGYNLQTAEGREIRFYLHFRGLGDMDEDLFDVMPLSGIIVFRGDTLTGWRLKELFYANQGPYQSATEMMTDYNAERLERIQFPRDYRKSLFDKFLPVSKPERQGSNSAPPRSYAPSGARYKIDGYSVTWLGWMFSISNNPMRGLSIYNARFKEVSVVYELSLQDILVNYVSDSHGESNVLYLLSAFNIGAYTEAILGLDCPERSTLLSTTYWDKKERSGVSSMSICVFEADGELPLWRRKGRRFASGLIDSYLVVRAAARIVNLDYIMEHRFHLDGSIDTNIHSLGSLQGSFWFTDKHSQIYTDSTRNAFGFRLDDCVGGISGSHSFNFKVDVDAGDRINRFDEITWKSSNVMTALRAYGYVKEMPQYFVINATQYPDLKQVTVETGLLKDARQQVWLVSAGEEGQGYRITIDTSVTDIFHPSHPAAFVASFTQYDLVVLKYHSNEPYFTNAYDMNNLDNSSTDIDDLLSPREDISNSDIVLSVNVGFMELPHTEDVPAKRRQTASFRLLPFNMFPKSPSLDVPSYTQTDDGSVIQRPPEPPRCMEPAR